MTDNVILTDNAVIATDNAAKAEPKPVVEHVHVCSRCGSSVRGWDALGDRHIVDGAYDIIVRTKTVIKGGKKTDIRHINCEPVPDNFVPSPEFEQQLREDHQ